MHLYPGVTAGKKSGGVSLPRRCFRAIKDIPWTLQSWLWGIRFSHAYIGFILDGIPLVYHSTAAGVAVVRRDVFLRGREVYAELSVPVGDERHHAFAHEAFGNVGKPYSNKQLLGIGLARFGTVITGGLWKPKSIPRWFKTGNSATVCSETMGRVLVTYCNGKFNSRDADLWSPADCLEAMRSLHRTNVNTHWTKKPEK